MKDFVKIMNISIQSKLYYRTSFLINLMTPVILLIGQYLLWDSLYRIQTGGQIGSMTKENMFSYILVAFALQNILTWSSENMLSREIRSGTVVSRFVRPVPFLVQSMAEMAGSMLIQGAVNLIVVLAGFALFSTELTLPTVHSVLLFLPCFVLASLLRMMLVNIFSLFCFFTTGHLGITWTRQALYDFFSGALIPVVMFPGWLKTITYVTPFPYMLHAPISILLQMEMQVDYPFILLIQSFWLAVFLGLYQLIYKKVRNNLIIAGG